MKRPVQLGRASWKALGAVVALGAGAHAAMPYLPLIGPPPLRVQTVKSPASVIAMLETTPALAATNLPVFVDSKNSTDTTNLTGVELPTALQPLIGPDTGTSLEDTFTATIFALPTPDLLGLTPQALAAYFRPLPRARITCCQREWLH